MNDPKILKISLAVVIIAAAMLGGITSYRYSTLNRSVETFSTSIGRAENDTEARTVINQFLSETEHSTVATSASADKWWCLWLCNNNSSPEEEFWKSDSNNGLNTGSAVKSRD